MAGILNIKKFKEENREELDSIIFIDMINGFLNRVEELKLFNFDVEMDRVINGKSVHQISYGQGKKTITNKIKRSRGHRECQNLPMKYITIDDINWVFGSRKELKNVFLDEIYYKYYM